MVDLRVTDTDGRVLVGESRGLSADGTTHLGSVPPGRALLTVSAKGVAGVTQAIEVPSDQPVDILLTPAGRLRVEVPELFESNHLATVTLSSFDGSTFQGMGAVGSLISSWSAEAGVAYVESLPAGAWTVQVTTADGRRWSTTTQTTGNGESRVVVH